MPTLYPILLGAYGASMLVPLALPPVEKILEPPLQTKLIRHPYCLRREKQNAAKSSFWSMEIITSRHSTTLSWFYANLYFADPASNYGDMHYILNLIKVPSSKFFVNST